MKWSTKDFEDWNYYYHVSLLPKYILFAQDNLKTIKDLRTSHWISDRIHKLSKNVVEAVESIKKSVESLARCEIKNFNELSKDNQTQVSSLMQKASAIFAKIYYEEDVTKEAEEFEEFKKASLEKIIGEDKEGVRPFIETISNIKDMMEVVNIIWEEKITLALLNPTLILGLKSKATTFNKEVIDIAIKGGIEEIEKVEAEVSTLDAEVKVVIQKLAAAKSSDGDSDKLLNLQRRKIEMTKKVREITNIAYEIEDMEELGTDSHANKNAIDEAKIAAEKAAIKLDMVRTLMDSIDTITASISPADNEVSIESKSKALTDGANNSYSASHDESDDEYEDALDSDSDDEVFEDAKETQDESELSSSSSRGSEALTLDEDSSSSSKVDFNSLKEVVSGLPDPKDQKKDFITTIQDFITTIQNFVIHLMERVLKALNVKDSTKVHTLLVKPEVKAAEQKEISMPESNLISSTLPLKSKTSTISRTSGV